MSSRLPLLLALIVATPAFAGDPASAVGIPEALQEVYRVGPRDVLQVEVYGETDLTGKWTVREDGLFVYPHIGEVVAAGRTVEEITGALTDALRTYYLRPVVSIEVAQFRSQSVQVNGAVKKGGEIFLTRPTTLLEVLGRVDVDVEKSNREILVRREDGTVTPVNLDLLLESGGGDLLLRDGDVITAKEGQFVYVAGEVAKPGAILFQEGLTVAQALTKAGGPSETARLRGAYLLREGAKMPVNLKRILEGREADVSMRPGDQLFLKESPI